MNLLHPWHCILMCISFELQASWNITVVSDDSQVGFVNSRLAVQQKHEVAICCLIQAENKTMHIQTKHGSSYSVYNHKKLAYLSYLPCVEAASLQFFRRNLRPNNEGETNQHSTANNVDGCVIWYLQWAITRTVTSCFGNCMLATLIWHWKHNGSKQLLS